MLEKDIKLYLSQRFLILGILLTGLPLVFFSFFAVKAYKENPPVMYITGVGALVFFVLFLEQIRFLYFIVLKKPVVILNQTHLTENLTGRAISWREINTITFCVKTGYKYVDRYILVTSKNSEETIKIRGRLKKADLKKELKSTEIVALFTSFKEKYGIKNATS